MKRRRNVPAVIVLSLILCLSGCSSGQNYEEEPNITVIADSGVIFEERDYLIPKGISLGVQNTVENTDYNIKDTRNKLYPYSYYVYKDSENTRAGYIKLYDSLYAFESKIDLTEYALDSTTVYTMFRYMLFDNPDFFFVDKELSFDMDGDTVKSVSVKYLYNTNEVSEYNDQLFKAVSVVKQETDKCTSNYDKCVFVHDFLIMNIEYAISGNTPNSSDILGGLLNGKGNAQSFAKCFTYLCRELDIMTSVAIGEVNASHMWNKIYFDNNWYNVDSAMDNVDSAVVQDWVKHGFIGLSDETIKECDDRREYNTSEDFYYPAPKAEKSLEYLDLKGTQYLVSTTDTSMVKDQIVEMIIAAKHEGCNYIEFKTSDIKVLRSLKETVLNQEKLDLYEILDVARLKGSLNINTENCGVTTEDWNCSVLIYVFDKN